MKKTIKRMAILLLALLVAFSACACGGSGGSKEQPAENGQSSTSDEPD